MNDQPIHILSLGAGVQSSTLALMAAAGEVTPMPVAAIFSDTQAEPASVYKWLEYLTPLLPFPVIRVSRGSLTEESLVIREHSKKPGQFWSKSLIPAHILNQNGTKGIMGRQCTYGHKLMPIENQTRKMVTQARINAWRKRHSEAHKAYSAARKEGRACPGWAWKEMQSDPLSVAWIGISLDEVQRMKTSRHPWILNRWPLIEKSMSRHDALRWMESRGYPVPPRSACTYCPFHSDAEWRRLRDNEPGEFQKAVEFEAALQQVKRKTDNMKGIPFLHSSLRPLGEVDFSTAESRGQGDLFGNECEGLCGV